VLTALLWITLAASIIALIAIASPIRVSCKAIYKENRGDNCLYAAAHYMHPLILRMEYSSTDNQAKLFILGFEKRRGVNKDDINAEDIGASGIDTENISTDSIGIDDIRTDGIDTNSISTDNISTNSIGTDSIRTDDINTGGINTDDADAKEKTTRFSLSKIKSAINNIKRNRLYKIISDKPMRKKLLRWLKRLFARAIRAISLEKLKIHARIGITDPTTLGKIYGYFSATKSALTPQHYHIDLSMEPVFTEKCLDINSELKIKTTLSTILWQLTVIAATFPYWKVRRIIKNV